MTGFLVGYRVPQPLLSIHGHTIRVMEDHHVEWALQDGRLFVLEVGTVRISGTVLVRSMWLDATEWDRATLLAWLGY